MDKQMTPEENGEAIIIRLVNHEREMHRRHLEERKRPLEESHHRVRGSDIDVDPWTYADIVFRRSSGQLTWADMEDIKNRFADFFREKNLLPKMYKKQFRPYVWITKTVDAEALNLSTSIGSAQQEAQEVPYCDETIRKRELEESQHRERVSDVAADTWAYMHNLCHTSCQVTPADLKELKKRFTNLYLETELVCKRELPRKWSSASSGAEFEKNKADDCSSQGSIGKSSADVDVGDKVQQSAKSNFENCKEAAGFAKKGQLYGFGPIGTTEIKESFSDGYASKEFLSWKEDPDFQEYLNSRLEEGQSEKERLKIELDQCMKKIDNLGKMVETLIRQFGGLVSKMLIDDEERRVDVFHSSVKNMKRLCKMNENLFAQVKVGAVADTTTEAEGMVSKKKNLGNGVFRKATCFWFFF